jgi:outer membrane immunogenic protein
MRTMLTALAALATAAFVTPAFAQDGSAPISGFRIEAHGGWDRVNVEDIGGKSGFTYGAGAGYDFGITDNFFIGVDGSIDESSTRVCISDVVVPGDLTCAKTGLDLSAGVRVGFASMGGKLYALGGYTRAKAKLTYDDGVTVALIGDWEDGWRVGAGYQYTFNNGVYIKAEYRYSDYSGGLSRHNVIGGVGYQF